MPELIDECGINLENGDATGLLIGKHLIKGTFL